MIVRGVIEPTNDLDVVSRGAAWAAARKLGQLVDLPEHGVTVATLFDVRSPSVPSGQSVTSTSTS